MEEVENREWRERDGREEGREVDGRQEGRDEVRGLGGKNVGRDGE